jgi:hypothetical protein
VCIEATGLNAVFLQEKRHSYAHPDHSNRENALTAEQSHQASGGEIRREEAG